MFQRTLERSKQSYANQGFDPRTFKPHVEASSVYIVVGGKKLGVVRLTLDHQVRSVSVLGFNVAISCVSHAFGQATTMYRYSPDPVAKKSLKRSVFQLNLRCHGRPLSVMSPNFSSSGRLFSGIAAEARRST